MENQITCPHCKRIIANNPVIDDAATRMGSDRQFITCACGEKITYWQIAELVRNQQKVGARIQNWFSRISKG